MNNYCRLRPFTKIEACNCRNVTGLLLVCMLTDNPIHCLECKNEIDPERLNLSSELVDKIADCFKVYGSLFRLELDSGEYETWAQEKLLDPNSQVNIQAMAIVNELSEQWPTYFWWFQNEEDGMSGTCPNCGEKLDGEFFFGKGMCKQCRVLV